MEREESRGGLIWTALNNPLPCSSPRQAYFLAGVLPQIEAEAAKQGILTPSDALLSAAASAMAVPAPATKAARKPAAASPKPADDKEAKAKAKEAKKEAKEKEGKGKEEAKKKTGPKRVSWFGGKGSRQLLHEQSNR